MHNHLKLILVAIGATLLAGTCFSQGTASAPTKPQTPVDAATYRLKPEDTVTIYTEEVPEASGEFLIRRDGYITVGIGVGDIKAAGLTTKELTDVLVKKLKSQVLDPKVTINVKSQSQDRFYIMGAVKNQGVFDCKPKWRITEAIAAAGGLASPAERTRIVLWRTGQNHQTISLKDLLIRANDDDNIEIKPGDVLNVQSDVTVRLQVVGQVKKAGIIEVLDGQGVAEALSASGGVDPEARLSEAKLVRAGKEMPIDLYQIVVKGHPEQNVPVQENDTLYIPQNTNRIAVVGSVSKPGPMLLQDGRTTTLTDAIGLAGGFTMGSLRSGVTVFSKDSSGQMSRQNYNVEKMIKDKKTNLKDPVLKDGDIVYVAESGKPGSKDLGMIFGALSFARFFGL